MWGILWSTEYSLIKHSEAKQMTLQSWPTASQTWPGLHLLAGWHIPALYERYSWIPGISVSSDAVSNKYWAILTFIPSAITQAPRGTSLGEGLGESSPHALNVCRRVLLPGEQDWGLFSPFLQSVVSGLKTDSSLETEHESMVYFNYSQPPKVNLFLMIHIE